MNALIKINEVLNKPEFFPKLIALVLSTLYIGYAPSSIALGILATLSLYRILIHKEPLKFQKELLGLVALYILFLFTLFWTVNTGLTLKGLGRTMTLLLIPIVISLLPKFKKKDTELIFEYYTKVNVVFGLSFILNALINYTTIRSFTVFTYHELVEFLDLNAIYVSIYFLISLAYLLSKKNKTKIDLVTILFFFGMILLLSSKMILLVLGIILGIYLVFFKTISILKNPKVILVIIVGIIIIGATSSQIINRVFQEKTTNVDEIIHREKFNRVYPWTGTSIRLLQARILYEQIEEESIFWTGFGLFASRENLKKRHLKFNTYYGYHTYNYHNQYAQILSEIGFFGLILLLIILLANFINAVKSKNFIFITFAIAMPLVFLTESFLWVQRGIIFFTLVYCILARTNFNIEVKKE